MNTKGRKLTLVGKVVSDKMNKTVVVEVTRKVQHPVFKKYILKRKKYKVHDEKNSSKINDRVLIIETKPISKEKSFRLKEIIRRGLNNDSNANNA